jgi:hypothetical protein
MGAGDNCLRAARAACCTVPRGRRRRPPAAPAAPGRRGPAAGDQRPAARGRLRHARHARPQLTPHPPPQTLRVERDGRQDQPALDAAGIIKDCQVRRPPAAFGSSRACSGGPTAVFDCRIQPRRMAACMAHAGRCRCDARHPHPC